MRRQPLLALAALIAVAGLALSLVQTISWVPRLDYLADDHASGNWASLAVDLANGMFYRPLQSDVGYGGTRYMPLFFGLHAAMIRAGLSPLAAGRLLSVAAAAGLLAGLYRLQRRGGTPVGQAAVFALLVLCSPPFNMGLVRVAGDLLSLALEVWGLAWCLGDQGTGRRRVRAAALFFTLAVLTKMTAVAGLSAATIWLWLRGERRSARELAASTLLGVAVLVGLANWLSDGRLIESFAACATGGSSLGDVLRAPVEFWTHMADASAALLLVALAAVVADRREARNDIMALWLLASVTLTVALFVSPGVNSTHIVMLDIATLMYLSWQVTAQRIPREFGLALAVLISGIGLAAIYRYHRPPDTGTVLEVAREVAGPADSPVLSENPWVPLLAGERPYILDPFNLRLLALQRPDTARDLADRIDRKYFRAVVLERRIKVPMPPDAVSWYNTMHFGPGFAERVLRNYELASEHRDFFIYRPKQP